MSNLGTLQSVLNLKETTEFWQSELDWPESMNGWNEYLRRHSLTEFKDFEYEVV